MTCASDLFTSLETLYTADTGSTGLYNPISPAYVPAFFQSGDSENRGYDKPRIEVEIIDNEGDRFTKDSMEVLIRYHLFTDQHWRYGTGERNQNAVLARMRTVFHRVALAAQSTWSFSETAFRGVVQAPVNLDTGEMHVVVNAVTTAREV